MPVITLAQATTYAQAAGFSGRSLDIILAIAQAESGLNTTATNTAGNSAGTDRGILQINSVYHAEVTDAQAFDPAQAFVAGYRISRQGQDFTPWSTFKNGAFRQYLPQISAMLPNALHFSEFQGGYHGTCGETALATALVCSTPQIESTQDAINLMLSMTKEMIGLGWAAANGSTTMSHLHDEAVRRGFHPDESTLITYTPSIPVDELHNRLLQEAGVKPVVIEIARAYALPGDEAGVDYHYICVVGISPQGYVCNDGDNSAISSHLVTYSWAEIEAASPCAVMTLEMAHTMGIPAGWSDDGSILRAPNGEVLEHAFRDFVLNHPAWDPMLLPVGGDIGIPGGDRHDFTFALEWDSASGQTKAVAGPDYSKTPPPLNPAVKTDLEAAQSQLASASASLSDALSKLS